MSEVFLNVPEIGRLYFKETLVEYDFPLIFICEDDYDSLYLFYETDEADEFMEWQTVKITRQTYHDILSNKISLQHVFRSKQVTPFLLIKHYYDEEKTELDSSYELQRKDVIAEKDSFLRDFGVSLDGEVNTDSQGDSSELEFEFYPGRPIDAIDSGIHSTICTEVTNIVNCMDNAEYLETRIGFPRVASYSIPIVVISSNAETVSASSVTKMLANLICTLDFNDEKLSKNKRVLISLNKIYEFINKTSEDMVVTYVSDDTQQKNTIQSMPSGKNVSRQHWMS